MQAAGEGGTLVIPVLLERRGEAHPFELGGDDPCPEVAADGELVVEGLLQHGVHEGSRGEVSRFCRANGCG
jgi:hypothetical protein